MSKIKNKIINIFVVAVVLFGLVNQSFVTINAAGSVGISASKGTVAPGETFTVTVSVSGGLYKVDNISVNNGTSSASALSSIDSSSASFSVTAGAVGTVDISVTGPFATYDPEEENNVSRSISVNVIAPTPPSNEGNNSGNNSGNNNTPTVTPPTTPEVKKSSDASLSELTISEGTLSPAFSADTTEYSVSLGKDVTAITIGAQANHGSASVSGTGEQTLKPGANELSVVCTAEDGSTRTYLIKANVDETPSVFVDFDNNKLGVVKDISSVSLPDAFEEMKVTLGDSEVPAWHNPLSKITVVYLVNDANEKNFYLYDEESKTITSIYKPMGLLGRNIAVIDVPKEFQEKEGMEFGEVEVSGVKMMGWKFKDTQFENYTLIYVMDEQGKTIYYLHEKGEDTLQLYSGQAAMTQEQVEEQASSMTQRMYLIIALLITNVLTVALLLIKILKKPKRRIVEKQASINDDVSLIKEEDLPLGHSVFKRFNEENEMDENPNSSEEKSDKTNVDNANHDFGEKN